MNLTLNKERLMSFAWALLIAYGAMLVPSDAFATETNTTIGETLCKVAGWFTGQIGQGIATIAIVIIGIGALMGKVSWGMAIIVGLGVAVVFGAPAIVTELASNGTGGCSF